MTEDIPIRNFSAQMGRAAQPFGVPPMALLVAVTPGRVRTRIGRAIVDAGAVCRCR